MTDPGALTKALDELGLPGAALVQEAGTAESKQRARTQTEDALRRGVFGVPTVEVEETGEMFWGQDAIPHVERYLLGNDPVSADLLERWAGLPKGAERPAAKGVRTR